MDSKARPRRSRKRIAIAAAAGVAIIAIFTLYLSATISSLMQNQYMQEFSGRPSASVSVLDSSLLYYGNASSMVPYALLSYRMTNATHLFITASLYGTPPPGRIYVLNTSNGDCYSNECANASLIFSYLRGDLSAYGMGSMANSLENVSLGSVSGIQNDSMLIVPTGLLPQEFLSGTPGDTLMDTLLQKGTSVIYIGRGFTNVLIKGETYTRPTYTPPYMSTTHPVNLTGLSSMESFSFSNSTFSFSSGANYGPLSYVNAYGGALIAFSNAPDSWPASGVAADLAKAISERFWLSSYASGGAIVMSSQFNSTGVLGLLLNQTTISSGSTTFGAPQFSPYMLITMYTDPSYGMGNRSAYTYLQYEPSYSSIASLSLPSYVVPGQESTISVSVFGNVSSQRYFLSLYNASNYARVTPLPPLGFNPSQFSATEVFSLPPGPYIASLTDQNGTTYASALFAVPSLNMSLVGASFQNNTYSIRLSMNNRSLSGVNYIVTLYNCQPKCQPKAGMLPGNGVITYSAQGIPELFGQLNFSISMLGTSFPFAVQNSPVSITITAPEVELAIVLIIVIVLMVAVKAPNRDDFYIDVPVMPKPKTIKLKLKPAEVLNSFDKLNLYYHWKYMPLSIDEVKAAIKNSVRYQNMPVAVTYNNAERLLESLETTHDLVSADALYAPSSWASSSGHDIEYLATFKKLRIWFVTHACLFTEINASESADIVATVKGERANIVIYSPTTKFKRMELRKGAQTYLAFLNSEKLLEFRDSLETVLNDETELLKMHINAGDVKLIDADNPGTAFGY